MAGRSHIVKRICLALGLGLLFLPMLQKEFQFFHEAPLHGAVVESPPAEMGWANWWSDSLQVQTERHLNDQFGFRKPLVRFNNQLGFWLYRTARARDVVIGKEGWLYEEGYLKTLTGEDYKGEERNRFLVHGLKEIQEMMARHGKLLLVVLAPGKGTVYPEYIPDRFKRPGEHATNYKDFARMLPEEEVLHIDGNAWFQAMKDTSRYPLYPKTGIHWSVYTKWMVVDSILHIIENRIQDDLPDLVYHGITVLDTPKVEDRDIERGMNLLYRIPNIPMAYPEVTYNRKGKRLMRNLTIAESYWWGIFGKGIAGKIFDEPEFWYYNEEIYGGPVRPEESVVDLDMAPALADKDVIIIMCTDAKLKDFSWKFVDRIMADPDFENRMGRATFDYTIQKVHKSKSWMEGIKRQAAEREISVDSMVVLSAKYHLRTRLGKN